MRDRQLNAGRPLTPSDWVQRFYGGIKHGGVVLDVACGSGRHFPLLLANGCHVVAIDRDLTQAHAFALRPNIELIAADLENGAPFPVRGRNFDGVIVTNYLWRPILADIVAAVAPDGVLIYETFGCGQERLGRPSNPDFLLRPGELLDVVLPHLRVIAFEHARLHGPDRVVQRITAVGLQHAWPGVEPPMG